MNLNKICNKNNITKDIENLIETYIYYDLIYYKNIHKNKFYKCLLEINQYWKFVSVFETGSFCEECYMESFITNTSYIDNCDLCNSMNSINNNILTYKLINYNYFINSDEIKYFHTWFIICNSNKELAKNIFYNKELNFGDKKNILGLNYEIKCGPILWTKKQTNNTILIKKYGNPIGLDDPNQSFYN